MVDISDGFMTDTGERICKHGFAKKECGECDSRGEFDTGGDYDPSATCSHRVPWTEACKVCDGTDGRSDTPVTKNDARSSWQTFISACSHTPDKPVVTINGCAIYAVRNGNTGDWRTVPSYHMLIDCLSDGAPALQLPAKLKYLQRYATTDEWTVGIPWDDYRTPPVAFGFWRALAKKLPRDGVCVVTCMGAHGRTGTAIAALLLGANPGMSDLEAIKLVREGHCWKAVEAECQKRYLKDMALAFAPPARKAEIEAEHAEIEAKLKARRDAEEKEREDRKILYSAGKEGVQITHYAAPCTKGDQHTGPCAYKPTAGGV